MTTIDRKVGVLGGGAGGGGARRPNIATGRPIVLCSKSATHQSSLTTALIALANANSFFLTHKSHLSLLRVAVRAEICAHATRTARHCLTIPHTTLSLSHCSHYLARAYRTLNSVRAASLSSAYSSVSQ